MTRATRKSAAPHEAGELRAALGGQRCEGREARPSYRNGRSGQISLRKIDGGRKIAAVLSQPTEVAA